LDERHNYAKAQPQKSISAELRNKIKRVKSTDTDTNIQFPQIFMNMKYLSFC